MGKDTRIAYCDSTVNPVMGCSGCELFPDHCYANRLVSRYAGKKGWPRSFTEPAYFPERLEEALRWSDLTGKDRPGKPWLNGQPRTIFVNDLSDGFCPSVDPLLWLAPYIREMASSPHRWLLLTKWPKRMVEWAKRYGDIPANLWFGTTLTTAYTVWRANELLMLPSPNLWLSLEPLLEEIDIPFTIKNVKVVVVGGESGPGARPMRYDWTIRLRYECIRAGTSFFFKQWGDAYVGPKDRALEECRQWPA